MGRYERVAIRAMTYASAMFVAADFYHWREHVGGALDGTLLMAYWMAPAAANAAYGSWVRDTRRVRESFWLALLFLLFVGVYGVGTLFSRGERAMGAQHMHLILAPVFPWLVAILLPAARVIRGMIAR